MGLHLGHPKVRPMVKLLGHQMEHQKENQRGKQLGHPKGHQMEKPLVHQLAYQKGQRWVQKREFHSVMYSGLQRVLQMGHC